MSKKPGRPSKYGTIDIAQVERLAGLGLTDRELAVSLNISPDTFYTYKKKADFSEAIKKGKAVADDKVVQSLYKRAIGYEYDEVTKEPVYIQYRKGKGGKKSKVSETLVTTKTVRKHVNPDVTAQIFWLCNRRPETWRHKKQIEHEMDGGTKELLRKALTKLDKAGK